MKPIAIIRITELLARSYAIWPRTVVHCPSAEGVDQCVYRVEGADGQHWCLHVAEGKAAQNDVLSSLLLHDPHPTVSGALELCHRGQYWTLFAVGQGESRRNAGTVSWPSAGLGLTPSPPRLRPADSRVLDRVGGWLAQPAGLPEAPDALGAMFLQQWHQARPQIAQWHAQAERLHDALQAEVQGLLPAGAEPRWVQWEQCCLLLHALQELQLLLLGPRALFQPHTTREQGVQRLALLLPQLQLIQEDPHLQHQFG